MAHRERAFTDVDFTVVRGPYRVGERHRQHRGWYFVGRYDDDGWPLFEHRVWWRSALRFCFALALFAAAVVTFWLASKAFQALGAALFAGHSH